MTAESDCLRADRDAFKDWEKFEIRVVNVNASLTVLTPFGPMTVESVPHVDLVLTYHVAFRAKISSKKNYDALVGMKREKVTFTSEESVWDFLPHETRNGYYIRSSSHPDLFWCVGKDPHLHLTKHRHEVECAFTVSYHHSRYYFKSVALEKYGSAESSRIVFNRDKGSDWEAFTIVVLEQLD